MSYSDLRSQANPKQYLVEAKTHQQDENGSSSQGRHDPVSPISNADLAELAAGDRAELSLNLRVGLSGYDSTDIDDDDQGLMPETQDHPPDEMESHNGGAPEDRPIDDLKDDHVDEPGQNPDEKPTDSVENRSTVAVSEDQEDKKPNAGKPKTRGRKLTRQSFETEEAWAEAKRAQNVRRQDSVEQMSEEELEKYNKNQLAKKQWKKEKEKEKKKAAKQGIGDASVIASDSEARPVDANDTEIEDGEFPELEGGAGPADTKGAIEGKTETRHAISQEQKITPIRDIEASRHGPADTTARALTDQPETFDTSRDAKDPAFLRRLLNDSKTHNLQSTGTGRNTSLTLDLEQRKPKIEAARQSAEAVAARNLAEDLRRQGISDRVQAFLNSRGHFVPHTRSLAEARQEMANLAAQELSLKDPVPSLLSQGDIPKAEQGQWYKEYSERSHEYLDKLKDKAAMGELGQEREDELPFLPQRSHSVTSYQNVVQDLCPIRIFSMNPKTYVRPADSGTYGEDVLDARNVEGGQSQETVRSIHRRGSWS